MNTNAVISWVLIISTFLIGGKALGLLNISWLIAFAPAIFLAVAFIVAIIAVFVLTYKAVLKNLKDE